MSKVIKVENLAKQYRLGEIGTGSITHDINRWWHTVRGKEDPYLAVGEENNRQVKGSSEYVWSLKNINFEINQGEAIGIIGKNGAGKSTLLKILSRVTAPTTGKIFTKGRIASLLEVGTGFHPELSGIENIFLNGAILGMRKMEIRKKLDEIVDFSGIERYIDTPVKRYSSGMYVRLAFAVAAHLESEILIVDEVLAVGDAEFQKKCLGKMKDVTTGQGRTVLFVSHNLAAVKNLCTGGMLLNNGILEYKGDIETAALNYLSAGAKKELGTIYKKEAVENKPVQLLEAVLLDDKYEERSVFEAEEDIVIKLTFSKTAQVPNIQGYLVIKNSSDEVFIESDTLDFLPNVLEELELGIHELELTIPKRILPNGKFIVYLNFTSDSSLTGFTLDSPKEILEFEVYDSFTKRGMNRKAHTSCIINWKKINSYAE